MVLGLKQSGEDRNMMIDDKLWIAKKFRRFFNETVCNCDY